MSQHVTFPETRSNVIAALRSLSDPVHQACRWGRVEVGVNYYDDLTLNVNILYDDSEVLPSPETAVPDVLLDAEVPAFHRLSEKLGLLIAELGNRPDEEYLADPRWPEVVAAARYALTVMSHSEDPHG